MQPNAKRSGGGREGSEIGSAVNVDKKNYSLLRKRTLQNKFRLQLVKPILSVSRSVIIMESNIELITRWKDIKFS